MLGCWRMLNLGASWPVTLGKKQALFTPNVLYTLMSPFIFCPDQLGKCQPEAVYLLKGEVIMAPSWGSGGWIAHIQRVSAHLLLYHSYLPYFERIQNKRYMNNFSIQNNPSPSLLIEVLQVFCCLDCTVTVCLLLNELISGWISQNKSIVQIWKYFPTNND